jgi:hypothetical protein
LTLHAQVDLPYAGPVTHRIPLLCAFLLGGEALAATTPDRPQVVHSAWLIPDRHLELEVGALYRGYERQAPARLKLGLGSWEPRLAVDAAGMGTGAPGLTAESKVKFLRKKGVALSGFFASTIPVGGGEVWWGTARAPAAFRLRSGQSLGVEAGIDLVGGGGLHLDGVPIGVCIEQPVLKNMSLLGEVAAVLDDGFNRWIIDGAVRIDPTTAATLDAGLGWDVEARAPVVQFGLTVSLGELLL